MATKLVIVESPAKAKTINKYLGNDYVVEASMGHIRDLPKTQFGVDVENNFKPSYAVMQGAAKRVAKLKKLAKGKDEIYLCPDPDREGEAISWHLKHIFEEAGAKKIFRVTFNEITKAAIQEAFKKPRAIDMGLVDAQQARRILDRIVGYKVSPLLWKNVAKGLSAGRVQSVALRLVMERELEIRKFQKEEYWHIRAQLHSEQESEKNKIFLSKLEKIDGEKVDISKEAVAKEHYDKIEKETFVVSSIKEKKKTRKPQAPFTTSKLQQESFSRLRFGAQKTMRVAQRLYEGVELGSEGSVGLITYMRTDSVNVSQTAIDEGRAVIERMYGKDHMPDKPNIYKSKKQAQEAHEAIRPSSPEKDPDSIAQYLDTDELKLYSMIWKKFIASQMVPAIDNVTSIDINAGKKYLFRTSGTRNLFRGFLACYDYAIVAQEALAKKRKEKEKEAAEEGEQDEFRIEDVDLPLLKEGETLSLDKLLKSQHFTKPPARYNDASLVKALEELGIGRPSTYAPTIQTIIHRHYVERKSSALMPTDMGEIVTNALVKHFEVIFDYKFTANMEDELDKIEEGKMRWEDVLKDFYGPFKDRLAKAEANMTNVKGEAKETEHKCTKCGKTMVLKFGRFGQFLACQGFPACRNTMPLPTGAKCPEEACGGDLIKRVSKNRRTFFGCSNYPKCTHITNKLPKKDNEEEEVEN